LGSGGGTASNPLMEKLDTILELLRKSQGSAPNKEQSSSGGDRPPRSVSVELFLVELPARKANEMGKEFDEKDLSGPLRDVEKRLETMLAKRQVAGFKRLQLITQDGQLGSLMLGENKPYVVATNVTATGITSNSLAYRTVGTQVQVTPHITADRSVTLALDVQDSRTRHSASTTLATDKKGTPIPATEFISTSLTGKFIVESGKAALAKDVRVSSKEGEGETFIVVGTRILDSQEKAP
jgi:hypothetical protein